MTMILLRLASRATAGRGAALSAALSGASAPRAAPFDGARVAAAGLLLAGVAGGGAAVRCECEAAPGPLVLADRSGARLEVSPWGAHVTSYKTAAGKELIFVSRDAVLDGAGAKAIRGGVPLCFPQFGRPDASYPQHGFLRNNLWKVVPNSRTYDARGAGISFELALKDVVHARGDGTWGPETTRDAKCTYAIRFDGHSLTTTLTLENTGSEAWDFQVLLHNYFQVQERTALDGGHCHVRGLEGYAVHDKVSGARYVLGPEPVTVPDSTLDRVYTPRDKVELNVVIAAGPSNTITLKASGHVDARPVAVSGVVWNPQKEKAAAMGDFGSDQYVDMLCVEPGLLDEVPVLQPGRSAAFTQVITSV